MAGSRLMREAQRGLSRFRNMTPFSLARTLLRAARLKKHAPRPRAVPARPERIVVSLTTIPLRAAHLVPVLRSLLDQTEPADRIVLALPRESLKGQPYPPLEALGLPPGVDILPCEDIGPATKLIPALRAEPDALIVVVDDDVIYPEGFIAVLLKAHQRDRSAAIGLRGVVLHQGTRFADLDHVMATGIAETRPVDVLFGTWGYLLPAGALSPQIGDFTDAPPGARFVDDVWISGHLARAGVKRLVVSSDTLPIETRASFRDALTLGVNRSGENDEAALKHFAKDW
jgi:hypothetical protein